MCVDEGMGPWKGQKKGVKFFVQGKPHANGIKLYLLADDQCYVYDFWVYQGKQPPTD